MIQRVLNTNIPTYPNAGLFAVRFMLGVIFLYHGSQKLFGAFEGPGLEGFAGWLASMNVPLPKLSAFLAAAAEFFGGAALLTGVGLRVLAIPLTFTMLVAAYATSANFSVQKGGMEYPLTLAFIVAGLALTGPGTWTLARVFARRHEARTSTVAA